MTDTPEAVRLADALEDIAATSSCMFEDEATEAAALLRRIPELEAERDRWRDAERSLSESYVRIREAIGAMRPPSLETDALWSYVEQTARDLVAERDQLLAELGNRSNWMPLPTQEGDK